MRNRVLLFGILIATIGNAAHGQSTSSSAYPRRTVTMVVPYSPGGATDILGRAAAQKLTELLGQQFIVVNRDGATGAIGSEFVAKSAPDGYTLLWGSASPIAINRAYNPKLPYDPLRDFTGVALFCQIPYMLVVHPSLPVRNVKELIALARAQPGKLNFASSGTGGAPHLSGELLKTMTGIDMVHVPYKGTALFMTDLLSGQIELAFTAATSSLAPAKAGRLRALAVTSTRRSPLMPELPTMAEAGVPGYELVNWYGMLAPSATPPDVVATLNAAMLRTLEFADVKGRIAAEGAYPAGGSSEQFNAFIREEVKRYVGVVSSIKPR